MEKITAAILVIGNEILIGRTEDKNVNFIAQKLAKRGIFLKEVRMIRDERQDIIENVLSLSQKYNYLFTTGGIGPTHDDITTESIAEAFGLELEVNHQVLKELADYYLSRGESLNKAREKMAHFPKGAKLIGNNVTKAPGFVLKNVFVLAGLPNIMYNMFEYVLSYLESRDSIVSFVVNVNIAESIIAEDLDSIQNKYNNIDVGSYPFTKDGSFYTDIVFTGIRIEELKKAASEFIEILTARSIKYEIRDD
ncbi:MAG: molybdopterin-binding protein [Rickettsiaceae bacterium]|nr:molybdopterin-binding protein [Rickettsiaceae bacterium]